MSVLHISQNLHALAVIASLEAGGLTVGDHRAPADSDLPYVVLYLLAGADLDGTASDPDSWGDLRFQLTSVGRLPEEARFVADKAAEALRDHPPVVSGRSVQRCRPIEASSPVQRDEDEKPPLYFVTSRYGAWTFPA